MRASQLKLTSRGETSCVASNGIQRRLPRPAAQHPALREARGADRRLVGVQHAREVTRDRRGNVAG